MTTVAQLVAQVSVSGAQAAQQQLKGVGSSVDSTSASIRNFATGAAIAGAAALVGVGIASTKMAADFQSGITSLVTGAGESKSNIKAVSDGILAMAPAVATSTTALTSGMYMIESAGFHGADGLNILKAAAEGAKVGNADLSVVSNALTTAMTDYHEPVSKAASVTNDLIATVANGKTTMADLSSSLSQILPIASSAGVSLLDTSAAMSTMTGAGVPAADAATYLRQTILAIENPTTAAASAMKNMGLSSSSVAAEMKVSLPGALAMITDAAAKKFPVGSAGYIAAISNMVGGTKSLQGIMDLTGTHMATFQNNVTNISTAVKNGGNSINGWTDVTNTFNFKMQQAQAVLETLGIKIGTALLPALGKLMDGFSSPAFQSFANQAATFVTGALLGLINGITTVANIGENMVSFFQHNQAALAILQYTVIAAAGAIGGVLVASLVESAIAGWAALAPFLVFAAPFIAIGAAIAGLAAVFIYLYNNVKPVQTFMNTLGTIIQKIWGILVSSFTPAWNQLVAAFQKAMPAFQLIGSILLGVVVVALGVVFATFTALATGIAAAIGGIVTVFTGLVEIVTGVFNIIGGVIMFFVDLCTGHFNKLGGDLGTIWQGIIGVFKGAWDVISGIFEAAGGFIGGIVTGFITGIVGYFQGLYDALVGHSIIPDMINGIIGWFSSLPGKVLAFITYLIAEALGYIRAWSAEIDVETQGIINIVLNWFSQLPGKLLGFWNTIKNDIGNAWNWIFTTISSKSQSIFDFIMQPFNNAKGAIGGVVKSFIDNAIGMLNNGITGVENFVNFFGTAIDFVAGKLGAGSPIPKFSIGRIPTYASGTDSHPGGMAMVGERGRELVFLPPGTQVAPNNVTEQLLGMMGGGLPSYASGIGNIASSIMTWVSGGAQMVLDNIIKTMDITAPNLGGMTNIASGIFDKVKTWALGFITKILPKFGGGGTGAGGTPVNVPGNLASWIAQAISLTHAPANWATDLAVIALHESGGNASAVNNWDSNAIAGHPSQGLFQMIPSTFAAHMLSGYTNILNPIANASSAIGYIMSRYGSVFNVPGIVSLAHGGSYVGYAAGTDFAPGGMAMVGERGPEAVYLPRGASVIPNNRLGGGTNVINVYVPENPVNLDGMRVTRGLMPHVHHLLRYETGRNP